MRPARRLTLLATSLLCTLHLPLAAQKIECVVPAEPGNTNQRCTLAVPSGNVTQPLILRLLGADGKPAKSQTVRFSLSPGASGGVTESVLTDANGHAMFTWAGQAGSRETVIRATARVSFAFGSARA